MAIPVFRIGDKVECELSPDLSRFRWDYDADMFTGAITLMDAGYSGEFIQGTVEEVDEDEAQLKFYFPSKNVYCFFIVPLPGNSMYVHGQFTYPGFPIRVNGPSDEVCSCGADKTYGPQNKFHSDWCGLYIPNPYNPSKGAQK